MPVRRPENDGSSSLRDISPLATLRNRAADLREHPFSQKECPLAAGTLAESIGKGSCGPLQFKPERKIVMNRNRESLIKRLVDRKLASTAKNKTFCVCMGSSPRNKNRCFAVASKSK
jgi:hypothetical protein